MYPSSSSSSPSKNPPTGLARYGSAPCSFLTTAVDSLTTTTAAAATCDFSLLGPHHNTNAEHRPHSNHPNNIHSSTDNNTTTTAPPSNAADGSRRPYCLNVIATTVGGEFTAARGGSGINLNSKGGGEDGGLVRQSSVPAGFLDHLNASASGNGNTSATDVTNGNGFPLTRAMGSYNSKGVSDSGHGISRLSFTREDSLSSISEERDNGRRKTAHSYATTSYGIGSWDDSSGGFGKRARNIGGDVVHCLNTAKSQLQFSLSQADLEMSTTATRLHIPQDSVPCKIRAKRGFATHPRSIAERDRRTRINGRLKKLQDYVPNLDKQTSYADMLDLAVQHIKTLQCQVQKLKEDVENCTCGCKETK